MDITESEIIKAVKQLNVDKSGRHDHLLHEFFKYVVEALVPCIWSNFLMLFSKFVIF